MDKSPVVAVMLPLLFTVMLGVITVTELPDRAVLASIVALVGAVIVSGPLAVNAAEASKVVPEVRLLDAVVDVRVNDEPMVMLPLFDSARETALPLNESDDIVLLTETAPAEFNIRTGVAVVSGSTPPVPVIKVRLVVAVAEPEPDDRIAPPLVEPA